VTCTLKTKTVAYEWKSFMNGELVEKEKKSSVIPKAISGSYLLTFPVKALAATAVPAVTGSSTWVQVFTTALGIADWLCVGVIMFAGVTWMFGNRTKAIELLMGVCSGYLVVRHSMDIMVWLRGI
jgi:hypothetical protein